MQYRPTIIRPFSRKDRMIQEQAEEEAKQQKQNKWWFPFTTTILAGTSVAIYYYWQNWNQRQCRVNFIFTETNFYNLGNYHSLLLCPLSFENNFFFYTNLPGLIYASVLIEKHLGAKVLLGSYLINCLASAATTTVVHRQIGFKKVQQRGRMSNQNGNATLFLSTLFAALAPWYRMYRGKHMATTIFFYYIPLLYSMLFFTNHITDPQKQSFIHAQNYNESHYTAVVLGAVLGLALRWRIM